MTTQTNIESAHQRQMRLEREERRRNSQWDGVVEQHRVETEQADALNRRAGRVESLVSRYDADEQFREQVAAERAARRTNIMIWSYIVLIAIIDILLATPDVSEWLASKAMVYVPKAWTPVEVINGHEVVITPVWFRLIVGANVVAAFLAITLGFKKITNETTLQKQRHTVEPGDTRNYNRLTANIWLLRALKVGYMASLAVLLFHLYDYDQQRARLVASTLAMEREMTNSATPQLLGSEGSTGGSTGSTQNAAPSNVAAASDTGLAKASAVVFCCLWLLHGILLVLPTDSFGKDLEFGKFRRSKVENQAQSMREEEVSLVRTVTERLFSVPEGEQRNQLVRVAAPIALRINEVHGFEVIPRDFINPTSTPSVNGAPTINTHSGNGAAPTAAVPPVTHGTNGHSHVAAAAPVNGTNGTHPVAEEEAPVADWDAIFPSNRA